MDNVQVAKAAIDKVFSDTSVPKETTADNLRELRDDIDVALDALGE